MKKFLLILIILFIIILHHDVYCEKVTVVPELMKPGMIAVRQQHLYVTEGHSVLIFSLNGVNLVKKFGKKGEGPEEFMLDSLGGQLIIDVLPDTLLVNSLGKLSYFSLEGNFIKEKKNSLAFYLQPLKDYFVGMSTIVDDKSTRYWTVNLYDSNLKKIKEIYRVKHVIQVQKGGGIHLLKKSFIYTVVDDKIYISGKEGFFIEIFNEQGKLLNTIKRSYKRRKVTPVDIKEIHRLLKQQYGALYERYKHLITIETYFPAIASIFVRNRTVYVLTNKEINEKWELFLYNMEGKFLKRTFIKMRKRNALEPFPTEIRDGNVYQMIENEESEEWELHVSKIL